jgi:spore coat protein U-like protein
MVSPIHCRKLHFFKKEKSMKMKLKQRNIKISIASAILAGTVGFSSASFATTFEVKTNVVGACTLETTDMDFGAYDTTSETPDDATSTITHTCTNGTVAAIAISQSTVPGSGSNEISPVRQMANGPNNLAYSISTSVGGAEWGNTKETGSGFTSNGSSTPVNVYGRIAAGLAVTAGNYTDSLTVTVAY